MGSTIHVAPSGNDLGAGSEASPLRTVSRAVQLARAGDTVVVHAGIYREWVRPAHGGTSHAHRITYCAAPGEHVVLTGSEPIEGWHHVGGDVWSVTLPDAFFRCGNPFREQLHGDWFKDKGRVHHTGDLFCDGVSLFEVGARTEVDSPSPWVDARFPERTLRTWWVDEAEGQVTLYANFGGADPREHLVEAAVRPAVLFPGHTGIDWITVRGFEIRHAATPWAPPTALQVGAVGPHWAKGWIIEDCHIHDVRCSGISLGKERGSGQNEWSSGRGVKHGTQHEREVVFRALQRGWSRETVGSHIVRRNHIHDCEQTGICGHLGAIFSSITDNHIHDIHWKRAFTGHEMAGMKLHAPIDTLVARNRVHHCTLGIWMDWQAQGTRISANLLYENDAEDLHVEVSHGPYTVDNNLLLSPVSIRDKSQGGAYLHNLIGGRIIQGEVLNRYTFYHVPHSTQVAGLMTIAGGDTRYRNNIVAPGSATAAGIGDGEAQDEDADRLAAPHGEPGTAAYDAYPRVGDERPDASIGSPDTVAALKLPVDIRDNWYGPDTQAYARETGAVCDDGHRLDVTLDDSGDEIRLTLDVPESLAGMACPDVTAASLGLAVQAEAPFENPDGHPLTIKTDCCGAARAGEQPPGPFAALTAGCQERVVWSLKTRPAEQTVE
jgi:hypothetical protein